MSKAEGLEEARKHIEAAYHALYKGGCSPAEAYEHVMGIAMAIWSHGLGYVTEALWGVVGG